MKFMRQLVVCLLLVFGAICQAQAKDNLLVMGDSLSAAHNLRQQEGWVSLLEKSIAHSFPNIQIINASVSGETTQGGLARYPALLKEYTPKITIIELGANDALRGYPLDQTKSNLGHMIERAQQSGAHVLLIGNQIPQNYGKRYTQMFFDLYKALANQYNVSYLPFMLKDVALNRSLMLSDGLHPNAQGQKVVLNNILPYLTPLLKQVSRQ